MRLATSVLLLLLARPVIAAVEPWSFVTLDLELRLTADPPAIAMTGRAVVRAEAESDGPTFGINSRAKVMAIRSLRGDGVAASIFPFKEGLPIEVASLKLPRKFAKGQTVEVEFTASSGAQSSQFVLGSNAIYASWVESWYPRPALSATELAPPEAPGTMTFRMPPGWRSVANGELVSTERLQFEVVEVWKTASPAARSFVAAPFAVTGSGVYLGMYLLKERPAVAAQTIALSKAVAAMELRFGSFPYPSFHIVEVPEGAKFAASSEQGFIMVRSDLLDGEAGNFPLFAHEAAHAWWGNVVRTDGPGGKMLSEAAAQYGAVLAIEAVEGEEAARRFLRYSRSGYNPLQCALGYFHIWREGGDKPLAKLESDRWDHNLADAKGHWFYRMVRHRLGDGPFFEAMRSILRDFSGRVATVADLRRAFLGVSSDPELPAFLSQWLDRTGAPVLRVEWWSADRGRGIEIEIEQLQEGEPFVLPLEIAIETDGGRTVTRTVQMCDRLQRYFLAVPARPIGIVLDPQDHVLLWRPEYGPRP